MGASPSTLTILTLTLTSSYPDLHLGPDLKSDPHPRPTLTLSLDTTLTLASRFVELNGDAIDRCAEAVVCEKMGQDLRFQFRLSLRLR